MAHEVKVILRAVTAQLVRAFKDVDRHVQALSRGIGNAFRTASKWILGAGIAVAGVAGKALSAYAEQENATQSLRSAFRAYGEEVDANVARLRELAGAIQDETGADDDALVAAMARMKLLGMETEALGDAAKGVLALKQAGMEEEAAVKALVAAREGEFGMLSRYIPALKTATSEAQKAAIVNDFLTRGYQASKDQLDTVAGSWAALKGRVGDAWETIGEAIAQNGALTGVLQQAGDKVKELTARFADWAASGGVTNLIAGVQLFGENVRHTFTVGWTYVKAFATGAIFPLKMLFSSLGSVAIGFGEILAGAFTLDADRIKRGFADMVNRLKEPWQDLSETIADGVKGLGDEEQRHAARVKQISDAQTAALAANAQKRVANETQAMEQIVIAAENHAKELAELAKRRAELEPKIAEEEAKRAADAEQKRQEEAIQAQIDRIDKRIAETGETAGMTVADFIDRQRQQKEQGEADAKDAARRARLEKMERDPTRRMSKEDKRFLDAQRAIEQAQMENEVQKGERLKLEADLDALRQKDSGNLQNMRDALTEINAREAELLRLK